MNNYKLYELFEKSAKIEIEDTNYFFNKIYEKNGICAVVDAMQSMVRSFQFNSLNHWKIALYKEMLSSKSYLDNFK